MTNLPLFIKTCRKDFGWLDVALRSIKRFGEDVTPYIVVDEREDVLEVGKKVACFNHFKVMEARTVWPEVDEMDGTLGSKWVKTNIHRMRQFSDEDYYLIWDSDIFAMRSFHRWSFCEDGRPIMFFQKYSDDFGVGNVQQARRERAMFIRRVMDARIVLDFMVCQPIWMSVAVAAWLDESGYTKKILQDIRDRMTTGFSDANVHGVAATICNPAAFAWVRAGKPHHNGWEDQFRATPSAISRRHWSWGDDLNKATEAWEKECEKL
jgi:hypothetical protein